MNVVFAGTPEFAVPSLHALRTEGYKLLAVYTQPDRPAGRGRLLTPSPVKSYAQAQEIPVVQPVSLKSDAAAQALRHLQPDVMVVVAYGLILPQAILDIPVHGCLNVHASLLPRWRGAAPIQRAIEAGDSITGVTIMQMDAGLDTGDLLTTVDTPLHPSDTSQTLHDRLARLGAQALVATLKQMESGTLSPRSQDPTLACYATKLTKEEALIHWQTPAQVLQRRIQAFNPWPMAYTRFNGRLLRLWEAAPATTMGGGDQEWQGYWKRRGSFQRDRQAVAGTILAMDADGIHVQTGEGVLTLLRLQMEGGRPLTAAAFRNGQHLAPGQVLGT